MIIWGIETICSFRRNEQKTKWGDKRGIQLLQKLPFYRIMYATIKNRLPDQFVDKLWPFVKWQVSERPQFDEETIEYCRAMLESDSRVFLESTGKPIDYWEFTFR